ncbi:hypothetical protein EIP91_011157 [Steccherinum ochraceum]|uniref:Uncharacterized protein n=1 Tax=Steccherinum ochraceum TaxID=92696 RepID=A0A4R0RWE5_9APHY|nr:hypothetical protein EIP91_011157 [Steccherinum ochraceum]
MRFITFLAALATFTVLVVLACTTSVLAAPSAIIARDLDFGDAAPSGFSNIAPRDTNDDASTPSDTRPNLATEILKRARVAVPHFSAPPHAAEPVKEEAPVKSEPARANQPVPIAGPAGEPVGEPGTQDGQPKGTGKPGTPPRRGSVSGSQGNGTSKVGGIGDNPNVIKAKAEFAAERAAEGLA